MNVKEKVKILMPLEFALSVEEGFAKSILFMKKLLPGREIILSS
jgi:hypothetical protein